LDNISQEIEEKEINQESVEVQENPESQETSESQEDSEAQAFLEPQEDLESQEPPEVQFPEGQETPESSETSESQELSESQEDSEIQDIGDIKFEEVLDIDKLQNELNQQMNPEIPAEQKDTLEQSVEVKEAESFSPVVKEQITDFPISSNSKKYVIYIESYNIDFIESLSINERKMLINKSLREQNEALLASKKAQEKKNFLIHLSIAVVTFIIGFPIIFFIVNKSMEITITNYNIAKTHFSNLYKEHGKIKLNEAPAQDTKY